MGASLPDFSRCTAIATSLPGWRRSSEYGAAISDIFSARGPCNVVDGSTVCTGRSAGGQALHQFLAMLVCLVLAIVGGMLTGAVARMEVFQPPRILFNDEVFWECEEGEEEQ